jgi:hypothetical protein
LGKGKVSYSYLELFLWSLDSRRVLDYRV